MNGFSNVLNITKDMSLIFYLLGVTLLIYEVTAISNITIEQIPKSYLNLTTGNSLWTSLIKNCRQPTMACVEKTMHTYLQDTLDYPKDFQVTSFMKLIKNKVNYEKIKNIHELDSNDQDEEFEEEPRSSIEEMSHSLHDKGLKFIMTHDMELQLPEPIFQGSTLKLSPRSFDGNGALIKFEFIPKEINEVPEGRIFKKIKDFISEKLMFALLAILLVIKLLAAKVMFLLPMMVGAVTAKKLLIKVLLFLFPALHHIFKLCAYVPHGTKYHHHKHQIAHVHHIGHHHHHKNKHKPPHHHHHNDGIEIIHPHADGPPTLYEDEGPWQGPLSFHHAVEIDSPHKPSYNPHEQELEYYSGGPALSHHFINHRQDSSEDENEVRPWGQGQNKKKNNTGRPLTPTEIEAMIQKAEKEAMLKQRLQQERIRIQAENIRLQEQLRQEMKLQEKLKQQAAAIKTRIPQVITVSTPSPFLQTPSPPPPPKQIQQPQQPPKSQQPQQKQIYSAQITQQQIIKKQTEDQQKVQFVKNQQSAFEKALQQAASITYDSFYSPILDKIDKILNELQFKDEPCRERLICSMYKNPVKFSPHSNLLSAELSRDSKELQKPKNTNAAVIRFYRYVQAARDGQDKRECLRLYPACSINTEQ